MMWHMSDVADVLVLLHGARGRVSTVRATVRMWRDVRRHGEALQRAGWVGYAPLDAPEPEAFEEIVRVWFAPPGRVREEHEGRHGAWVGVCRGGQWWRYDEVNGAMSNEGTPPDSRSGIGDELEWLLDPAPAMGMLEFDTIVRARRAGRPVLRVRAVPRTPAAGNDGPLMRLGAIGADELLLEVDAERGALLRIESRFEREPIALSEVVEIAYDEAFADDTFVFTPPPGEAVRSVVELLPVQHDLTVEQAVAVAPFTVWIPARVPADWEAQIGFAVGQHRPAMAPHVFLHYRAPDGTYSLRIAESPADGPRDLEAEGPGGTWHETQRGEQQVHVREPTDPWQTAQARVELDGTRILIQSTNLTADALADVAAGLIRAPTAPPEIGA
jgi:outer membrane lipoprotein-sorting protein